MDGLITLWQETGIANFELEQIIMILVGCTLLFLAIRKGFEPLLLLPIGFGAVLANIPNAGFTEPGGLLYYVYHIGIESGVFPLLIFMGVGAMTDFGALIANPKTLWLGAAAQLGILLPCLVPFCSTLYRAWNSLWLMPRRLQSLGSGWSNGHFPRQPVIAGFARGNCGRCV